MPDGVLKSLRTRWIIPVLLVVFVALCVGTSLTKRPWSDEGWFAGAGYNLAFHGKPGTLVLEPRGYREGIDKYTYWTAPLYYPLQAGWYRLVGFSLFSMRTLSTVFGVILIVSVFFFTRALFKDDAVAMLTAALLSFDYVVVMGGSFGRMDIICTAFGWAALGAYFLLREKNFPLALFASQTLVVLSGLTHFLGIIYFFAFWFIVVYFDRSKLSLRAVLLSFTPYIVGAIAWGAYIMQAPELFMIQFGGNAQDGGRLALLADPVSAITKEITERYVVAYGLATHSAGSSGPVWLKSIVLFAYLLGIGVALSVKQLRSKTGTRIAFILLAIFFTIMTLLDGQKLSYYLLNIVPVYSVILAAAMVYLFRRSQFGKLAASGLILGVLALQFGGLVLKMRTNGYANQFTPAAEFIKSNAQPGDVAYGSAELAFALGFEGQVVDDHWLGFERGRLPRFFVIEEVYEDALDGRRKSTPEVYSHVTRTLEREYELVYDRSHYQIFMRRSPRSTADGPALEP